MILRVPHYFMNFKCTASECKDNCCKGGWEIDIDEDTYNYYNSLSGCVGDELRAAMTQAEDSDEHCFILRDGQCPFLNERGLCGLYERVGEEHLGVVCTQFPRFSEYYGSVKETGIGLACEEAERIIFRDREPWRLVENELDELETDDEEYDCELAPHLWRARQICAGIIDGEGSIGQKLACMIEYARKLQDAVNDNDYDRIDECTWDIHGTVVRSDSARTDIEAVLAAYGELEVLGEGWTEALDSVYEVLHSDRMTDEEYLAVFERLDICLGEREAEYRNLLKYYLFRYFMEAAYDHDVFGKLQLMATNYLVIREMDAVRFIENGENFSFQDRIDVVHIFSREVEYSEDNLETLAEEFMFDEVFKAKRLVGIVLV